VAVAALTALAVLGLGTPAAGVATDDPEEYLPVAWMECDPPVGGELALQVGGPAWPGAYEIDGVARLEPCRPPKDDDAFVIATYATPTSGFQPRVRAAGGALYEWLSPAGTVSGQVTVTPDVYAACLVVESDVRVGCFRLVWTLGGGLTGPALTGLTPLSPQDPTVSWPAPLPQIPAWGGACPGCWVEHGVTD
jgi:hypothetical protein